MIVGEGAVPADADGLARLVIERGIDVRAVVEMMSGAIWVRDPAGLDRERDPLRWRQQPVAVDRLAVVPGLAALRRPI